MDAPACFSRFYKRKQIAPKEQSLLKELIPTENEDPWGAHKIKRNNFASPKIVSLHLEFQSKSPTELWMFLLCSNFYKEENVCSNYLSFEFSFPFLLCLMNNFPGNIVVHVVHKWHDGLKNKKQILSFNTTIQWKFMSCTQNREKPETWVPLCGETFAEDHGHKKAQASFAEFIFMNNNARIGVSFNIQVLQ